MKVFVTLALAGLGSSFVLPEEQVFIGLSKSNNDRQEEKLPSLEHITEKLQHGAEQTWTDLLEVSDRVMSYFDFAVDSAGTKLAGWAETFDTKGWMEPEVVQVEHTMKDEDHEHPPHHGPPRHGRPHHPPPHHGRPHHPPHHDKSNKTVYELIAESKYTTKLAKLINDYPDIVAILNGTTANFTVFAPTGQ